MVTQVIKSETASVKKTGVCSVSHSIYSELLDEVNGRIVLLPKDKIFNLKAICSDDFWNRLSNGVRRELGAFFHQYINDGHDSIEFVKLVGKNCFYRLKG